MDLWLFFYGNESYYLSPSVCTCFVAGPSTTSWECYVELHLRINGAKGVFVFAFFFVFVMLSYTWESVQMCATCVKFMQSGVDAAGDKWPAADSINNFFNALKTLKRPKKQFHNHFQKLKRLKTSRHPKETHANICAPPMVLLYQREYLWRPCRKHK